MTAIQIAGCVIGVLLLIAIIEMILAYIFANYLFNKKPYTYQSALDREISKGNIDGAILEGFSQEEFTIQSENGYHLYGRYFLQENLTKKTAVIMHGHAGNLIWSYKYAKLFEEMGYNWFIFDNRGCGKSGGVKYTMGDLESGDLACVAEFAKSVVSGAEIVLHGESLGASTAILAMDKIKGVRCVVADCGFSSLKEEVEFHMKKQKLPWHFVGMFGLFFAKVAFGVNVSDVSPIDKLKNASFKTPILFIHGKEDVKTPAVMCEKMYQVYSGEKEIYLCEGAAHARSYSKDKEKYANIMKDFCDKHICE